MQVKGNTIVVRVVQISSTQVNASLHDLDSASWYDYSVSSGAVSLFNHGEARKRSTTVLQLTWLLSLLVVDKSAVSISKAEIGSRLEIFDLPQKIEAMLSSQMAFVPCLASLLQALEGLAVGFAQLL